MKIYDLKSAVTRRCWENIDLNVKYKIARLNLHLMEVSTILNHLRNEMCETILNESE